MRDGFTGLDHVLIGVRDLESARERYARLGFTLTPRGRHVGWSTGNYCIMFGREYLELIGVIDPTQPRRSIEARIAAAGDVGVGFALASDDPDAAFRVWSDAELAPERRALARPLDLPEGTVEPRFALIHVPAAATPEVPIFVCHHLTPDLVRRPGWTDHANGALGVRAMLAVVADPAALRVPYERLFGPAAMAATDGMLTVRMGPTTLVVATAEDAAELYPAFDATPPAVPSVAALTITVVDIARAARVLEAAGVGFERDRGRAVIVPAAAACGVLLEFSA
ncbi:MAG: VOC family protein [Alphaproteobacteria bacterium]|nr:VOC family protein [Alphaproteobacteria bacterium]